MRVICNLPNASNVIDGKVFVQLPGRAPTMVSEEIERTVAERLLGIPGFQAWQGDEEAELEVEIAVDDYKRSHGPAAASVEEGMQRDTIRELQNNLEYAGRELAQRRNLIEDLQVENRKLKELLGPPSREWKKDDLIDYAESNGVQVQSNDSKGDILEAIARHVANEPAVPKSSKGPKEPEGPKEDPEKDPE